MHECPFCGEVCDCDIDDTWGLPVPDDCPHTCYEQEDEEGLEWDDDDWDMLEQEGAPPTPEANDQ